MIQKANQNKGIESILFSFNINNIVKQACQNIQIIKRQKQKECNKISVQHTVNDGLCIPLLFAYNIGIRLKQESFSSFGKKKRVFLVNQTDFQKLVKQIWGQMGKYENFLPLIWRLLRYSSLNSLSLKKFDRFLECCYAQINPFMAYILQKVPKKSIERIVKKIQYISDQEDLLNTNLIDTEIIRNIFQQETGLTVELPKQLIQGNKIKYKILIGQRYLKTGQRTKQFLIGAVKQKIVKVIRAIGKKKSNNKGKKTVKRPVGLSSNKKKGKGVDLAIKQLIESKKVTAKDESKKWFLVFKKLMLELIEESVQVAEEQMNLNDKPEVQFKKSLYINEPQLAQLQYINEGNIDKIGKGWQNTGIMINNRGKGQVLDLVRGEKLKSFNIQGCRAWKASNIVDFSIQGQIMYILRDDGLLYCWKKNQDFFLNSIQTSYVNHKSLHSSKSLIFINEGLIFINCTEHYGNKLQIYSCKDLSYIGQTTFDKVSMGIQQYFVEEALFFLKKCFSMKVDKILKQDDYKELLKSLGFSNQLKWLGDILYEMKKQWSVDDLISEMKWIVEFRKNNIFPLHENLYDQLKTVQKSSLSEYLQQNGYIGVNSELQSYIEQNKDRMKRLTLQQRRQYILTIYQDYNLEPLRHKILTKLQFRQWLKPTCFEQKQIQLVLDKCHYNQHGMINLSLLVQNQHFQMITYKKVSKVVSQTPPTRNQAKILQLPNSIIKKFITLPEYNIIIFTLQFPPQCCFYVTTITDGKIICRVDIKYLLLKNTQINQKSLVFQTPGIYWCQETGYILSTMANHLQIWKTSSFYDPQCSPTRICILDEQPIINLLIMYNSNTLLTLSKTYLRVWDFQQLKASKSELYKNTYRVKAGYTALMSNQKQQLVAKKKIAVRGQGIEVMGIRTGNGHQIISILSKDTFSGFLRIFHLKRYELIIKNQKRFEQVPLKLIRQLQKMASKNKYITNQAIPTLTPQAIQLFDKMVQDYRIKMSIKHEEVVVKTTMSKKLIVEGLNNLFNFYTIKLFQKPQTHSELQNQIFVNQNYKSMRINLILTLITSTSNIQSLIQPNHLLINTELIKMYQPITSKQTVSSIYNRHQFVMDIMDSQQQKTINRIFHLCSLIDIHSIKFLCSLSELITSDSLSLNESKINLDMVWQLIKPSESMCFPIVKYVVNVLNTSKQPLGWVVKIINRFLPTYYKWMIPRYYKDVVENKQISKQFIQFSNNRCELLLTKSQVQKIISSSSPHADVKSWYSRQSVKGQNVPIFDKIFKVGVDDNYQLIRTLMGYNMITEYQAIKFVLAESQAPTQLLKWRIGCQNPTVYQKLQQIIGFISYNIDKNKISLPKPTLSWTYFIQNLLSPQDISSIKEFKNNADKGLHDIFYQVLHGNQKNSSIYTTQLTIKINIYKMKVALTYSKQNWDQVFSKRQPKNITKTQINNFFQVIAKIQDDLKQYVKQYSKFPSLITASDLYSMMITQSVQDPGIFVNLAIYASKNHPDYIAEYFREKEPYIKQNHHLSYINVQHLCIYTKDRKYKIDREYQTDSSRLKKSDDIQIPRYAVIEMFMSKIHYLNVSQFTELLSLNLVNIKYWQYLKIIEAKFCDGAKHIDPIVLMERQIDKSKGFTMAKQQPPKVSISIDFPLFGLQLVHHYKIYSVASKISPYILDRQNNISYKDLQTILRSPIITKYIVKQKLNKKNKILPSQFEYINGLEVGKLIDQLAITPAMEQIFKYILFSITPKTLDIIQQICKKSQNNSVQPGKIPIISIKSLQKLLLNRLMDPNEVELLSCLIRWIASIDQKTQSIDLRKFSNKAKQFYKPQIYQQYKNQFQSKIRTISEKDELSWLEIFLNMSSEQHFTPNQGKSLQQLKLGIQHINEIISLGKLKQSGLMYGWYLNMQCSANVTGFFNHILEISWNKQDIMERDNLFPQKMHGRDKIIESFVRMTILKIGVKGLWSYLGQEKVELFSFFQKIKSLSKQFVKWSLQQLCIVFVTIAGKDKYFFTKQQFCNNLQPYIPLQYKIQWLKQFQQKSSNEYLTNLTPDRFHEVAGAFHYPLYLIIKLLNYDQSKLKVIHQTAKSKDTFYRALSQFQINIQKYGQLLYQYFHSSNNLLPQQQIPTPSIPTICKLVQYLNTQIYQNKLTNISLQKDINIHPSIIQYYIKYSPYPYYLTYHTFLIYFHQLFLKLQATQLQVRKDIKVTIANAIKKNGLNLNTFHEGLNLSNYENILKYMWLCLKNAKFNFTELEAFFKYNQKGLLIQYPLSAEKFGELIGWKLHEDQNRKQKEQLKRYLDIWGIGKVNLHDFEKYRMENIIKPYINIQTYVNNKYPSDPHKHQKYISPPQSIQSTKIISQLIKYEDLPLSKYKTISCDKALEILEPYLSQQHIKYVSSVARIPNDPQNYNIAVLIDWLRFKPTGKPLFEDSQVTIEDIISKIVDKFQNEGGIYMVIQKWSNLDQSPINSYELFLKTICSKEQFAVYQDLYPLPSSTPKLRTQLIAILTNFYINVREWNSFNNPRVKQIKNLPLTQFKLVYNFYHQLKALDPHYIFHDIIQRENKQYFTMLTLQRYMIEVGLNGYSKMDMREVYELIDNNGDGKIEYKQFIRFWMSLQQCCYSHKDEQNYDSPIQKMKNELLQNLYEQLSKHSISEIYSPQQLCSIFQITNKEKMVILLKLIQEEPDNVNLYSLTPEIPSIISVHKLYIKTKKNKKSNNIIVATQKKLQNHLIRLIGPDLLEVLHPHNNIQKHLQKWMIAKYGTPLGMRILQYLYDHTELQPKNVLKFIKERCPSEKDIKVKNNNKSKNEIMKRISDVASRLHKNYGFKQIKIKQYGQSLGGSLVLQILKPTGYLVKKQIEELQRYNLCSIKPLNPVTYSNQLSIFSEKHPVSQKLLEKQWFKDMFDHQKVYLYNKFIKQTIKYGNKYSHSLLTFLDQEIKCKSRSKVNLHFFQHLYKDQKISSSFLLEAGNLLNLQTVHPNTYVPLISLHPNVSPLHDFTNIIQSIVQLLIYSLQQYRLTGLLVHPSNIQISLKDNFDCKFRHFYHCIKVDKEIQYEQGIDINYILTDHQNQSKAYAPEIDLGVFTTSDVYQLGKIIYYLMTGKQQGKINTQLYLQQNSYWQDHSNIHKQVKLKLLNNSLTQYERHLYCVIYNCTKYDWFDRPNLFQLQQVLTHIHYPKQSLHNNLFKINTITQTTLNILRSKPIQQIDIKQKHARLSQLLSHDNTIWKMQQLIEYRQLLCLPNNVEGYLYESYNKLVINFMKYGLSEDVNSYKIFMCNLVDYILSPSPTKISICKLANCGYKQVLNDEKIKWYMSWCDEQWKIKQFNIFQKVQQLNTRDRINKLHKSSIYYGDIGFLAQCRIQFYKKSQLQKKNNHDTGKKMAVTFLHSSILSNNVNKAQAVYRSNLIASLYRFLQYEELTDKILQILNIITSSCIPQHSTHFRTVDEAYKVIMVIYNILSMQNRNIKTNMQHSSISKSSTIKTSMVNKLSANTSIDSSVVDILSFLNDYYAYGGKQCKQSVLFKICIQQIVTNRALLLALASIKNNGKVEQILCNLSYNKQAVSTLSEPTIQAYTSRFHVKKITQSSLKMQKILKSHESNKSLLELSAEEIKNQTIIELCQSHIHYYLVFITKQRPNMFLLTNFYHHFINFLQAAEVIAIQEIPHSQKQQNSINIIKSVVKLHYTLLNFYTLHQSTPINFNTLHNLTTQVTQFLMLILQQIYQFHDYYQPNHLLNHQIGEICLVQQVFLLHQQLAIRHPKLMFQQGYIHYYLRIIKRQHELLLKYIDKGVENIHLIKAYPLQAQYRINVLYNLLTYGGQKIHAAIIQFGVIDYILEMLNSKIVMDLRSYRVIDDTVPYRFCHPLRAEAITIIGYILKMKSSGVCSHVANKLIQLLPYEKNKLVEGAKYEVKNQKTKVDQLRELSWVQSLWVCSSIMNSQEERLKYELMSIGIYEVIEKVVDQYDDLKVFFPEMYETMRSGALLSSSLVVSQSLKLSRVLQK